MRPSVLVAPRVSASADKNSVNVSDAPSSSQTVRNGRSVTDAIGASTLDSQAVTWTPGGRPSKVTTTRGSSTTSALYSYDNAGQLTKACTPTTGNTCLATSPSSTLTYDLDGNRTSVVASTPTSTATSVFDTDDRLTSTTVGSATPTIYSYNPNGALTGQTSSAGTRTYGYALDGNLNAVSLENGQAVTFGYDESGNRNSRAINGTIDATWTWDTVGGQAFRTKQGGNTVIRWFEDPQNGLGTAGLQVNSTATPTWLLPDYLGSITTLSSATAVTGTATYDAFGTATNTTGTGTANPLQFQGQYRDSSSGLYDMRARDYDPATNRFTTTDPHTNAPGTGFAQTYEFASNNPTTITDPSGACPWCIGALVGAVIGAAAGGIANYMSGDCGHNDCTAQIWTGIGVGALTGALAGVTLGSSLLGAAVIGGAGSALNGYLTSSESGRSYSGPDGATDFLFGAAGGALAAGGGRLIGAGIKMVSQRVAAAEAQRVAELARNIKWNAENTPKPFNGDPHSIECSNSTAAETVPRLARDVAVSPIAPRALGVNRSIGRASHNAALGDDIAELPRGATDIRVNQQQVNAAGQRVGINRPDLQYTLNGDRFYSEYEGLANPRGAAHESRILSNDPFGNFNLWKVP